MPVIPGPSPNQEKEIVLSTYSSDADKEYSDQGLKNGLYKLLNKTTEGFNSKDLSDAHIQEMGNILTQRILDENYEEKIDMPIDGYIINKINKGEC